MVASDILSPYSMRVLLPDVKFVRKFDVKSMAEDILSLLQSPSGNQTADFRGVPSPISTPGTT
ncbi:hypothetical protein HS1genome_2065 [Sulfodiicoccus acidiphilus]|uniref:Uncharacterized protein n=1 Tax=Sulfodiicoccus acidiphilus TaxID=1670455 RepID=A0A348B674_9CREN|nr:hypothetical protein [Sulfodiicoccus acidiphilus]BBD73676.1 hypothetical protein HS1genome_2065 [Sulfodiicoccus acidiphilus]GGU05917.1 hypothetical protein GCM10007116_22690 [Sulfodiicoccus acidiphilus]